MTDDEMKSSIRSSKSFRNEKLRIEEENKTARMRMVLIVVGVPAVILLVWLLVVLTIAVF